MNAVLAQNHARRVNKRRGILAKNNAQKHFKGWQKQYYISKASVAKCMLVRIISEISNHACIGLDMSVYLINEYICMKNDLQLGKLKENCSLLITQALSQTQKNVSEPLHTHIFIDKIY